MPLVHPYATVAQVQAELRDYLAERGETFVEPGSVGHRQPVEGQLGAAQVQLGAGQVDRGAVPLRQPQLAAFP